MGYQRVKKPKKTDVKDCVSQGKKASTCLKRCGTCCTFAIIKTKNLECKPQKKGGWHKIETELRSVDANFFKYHGIAIASKKHLMKKNTLWFVFKTENEIKEKIVGDEKLFKIDLVCKHLKNNKCKIYRARPVVCQLGVCPLNNEVFTKW